MTGRGGAAPQPRALADETTPHHNTFGLKIFPRRRREQWPKVPPRRTCRPCPAGRDGGILLAWTFPSGPEPGDADPAAVVIAVMGGYWVASGRISLGDVVAFMQYSRQFTMPII